MKRFRFPLEGLLKVRDLQQKQVMAEMADITERVNLQRSIVERTEREYREEMERFALSQGSNFSIDLYRTFDRYIDRLEAEKGRAEKQLEEMRPELEHMQAKLLEARRKKRVVELLRERHLNRYKEELRRQERRELYELNQLGREVSGVSEITPAVFDSTDRSEEHTEDLRTREARRRAEYLKQAGLTEEQARRSVGSG
jgi:flagellar FliJ protein